MQGTDRNKLLSFTQARLHALSHTMVTLQDDRAVKGLCQLRIADTHGCLAYFLQAFQVTVQVGDL